MKMARLKKALNVYIDPDLAARLEAWIKAQEAPWNKTAIVEHALAEWLDERDGSKKERD